MRPPRTEVRPEVLRRAEQRSHGGLGVGEAPRLPADLLM